MEDDTSTNVGLQTHTMWSETLLEDLYGQLRGGASDEVVQQTLKGLQARGMPAPYLVRCVRAKIGDVHGNRVERLISGSRPGRGGKKASGGRKKPRPSSSKAGVFAQLKGLFSRD